MSAHGWCWRCAEREQARRGVDLGRYQGPLCERCELELDEYHRTFTPAPVLEPEQYERVVRVRQMRPAGWRR